jgi:hypothetical protein
MATIIPDEKLKEWIEQNGVPPVQVLKEPYLPPRTIVVSPDLFEIFKSWGSKPNENSNQTGDDTKLHLQPHQQRVIDEKAELDKKAIALSNFIGYSPIFETLDQTEQERLKQQNDVM